MPSLNYVSNFLDNIEEIWKWYACAAQKWFEMIFGWTHDGREHIMLTRFGQMQCMRWSETCDYKWNDILDFDKG